MTPKFPIKKLKGIVKQSNVRNRGDHPFDVYSVTNSEGFAKSTDYFSKEVFSKDLSNYKIVQEGQFAYNPSRINVGSVDYLRIAKSALISPLYVVFETDEGLDSDYLLRFLKSNHGNHQIRSNTAGAVRDSLKFSGLENVDIPFPPLEDQKRIAYLLGKVEQLIEQRKQHLQDLDDLLKSVFLDMFGDPVRNEKGWDFDSLSNHGSYKNGLNFRKGETGNKLRCLGVGDFQSHSKLSDATRLPLIEIETYPKEEYFLNDGDLVFVRSNGNRALVGRCLAVYPGDEKVTYSGFCIRYRIKEEGKFRATYLSHLFRDKSFRRSILQVGQGANIQNINQSMLSSLKVPKPPIELQDGFSETVDKVDLIRNSYQKNLTELEKLYGSLSQRAFSGELDLSCVPIFQEIAEEIQIKEEATMEKIPEIELPQHEDHDVNSDEGRKATIDQWFSFYQSARAGNPIEVNEFVDLANRRLEDLMDEPKLIDVETFDRLSSQVWEQLKSGNLQQSYDEETNSIKLTRG